MNGFLCLDALLAAAGAVFLIGFSLGALVAWDVVSRQMPGEEREDHYDA